MKPIAFGYAALSPMAVRRVSSTANATGFLLMAFLLETETRPLLRDRNGTRNTLDRPVREFEIACLRERDIPDFKQRLRAGATLAWLVARANSAEPTLAKAGAALVDCRARGRRG